MKYYLSIHGNNEDGYRLMVYRYAQDGSGAVSPHWQHPKNFKDLKSLNAAIKELYAS